VLTRSGRVMAVAVDDHGTSRSPFFTRWALRGTR
jgi:hypothetical protein